VRVGDLRGEVHAERVVPLDVLVANLDGARVALLDQILLEHRVDDRVEVLVDALEEEGEAEVDSDLEVLEEVRVVEGAHLQVGACLLFLDPEDRLMLRVDAQGYELEVLKGASKTLESVHHVFCEVNSREMYEGCPTMEDLSNFLSQYGFTLRENWWTSNNWGDAYWSR